MYKDPCKGCDILHTCLPLAPSPKWLSHKKEFCLVVRLFITSLWCLEISISAHKIIFSYIALIFKRETGVWYDMTLKAMKLLNQVPTAVIFLMLIRGPTNAYPIKPIRENKKWIELFFFFFLSSEKWNSSAYVSEKALDQIKRRT